MAFAVHVLSMWGRPGFRGCVEPDQIMRRCLAAPPLTLSVGKYMAISQTHLLNWPQRGREGRDLDEVFRKAKWPKGPSSQLAFKRSL